MESTITILIKTFERYQCLTHLLDSIQKVCPSLPIVIVDDSQYAIKRKNEFIKKYSNIEEYIILPYDSGLSQGRHIGLQKIKTPYFLLCDDDFIMETAFDEKECLSIMGKYGLDILGGRIFDTPTMLFRIISWLKQFIKGNRIKAFMIFTSPRYERVFHWKIIKIYKKIFTTEYCSNYFIWNTERIKKSWDWLNWPKIKHEHHLVFNRVRKMWWKIWILYHGLQIAHRQVFALSYLSKRFWFFRKSK